MSNKKLGLILLVVAITAVAGFGIWKFAFNATQSSKPPATTTSTASTTQSPQGQDEEPTFTIQEVSGHNVVTDCWTVIDGTVYDLTDFIAGHPGGSEIVRACGIDGTSLFTERTTEDGETVGSGTPHSTNAENQLASLQIGVVAE